MRVYEYGCAGGVGWGMRRGVEVCACMCVYVCACVCMRVCVCMRGWVCLGGGAGGAAPKIAHNFNSLNNIRHIYGICMEYTPAD